VTALPCHDTAASDMITIMSDAASSHIFARHDARHQLAQGQTLFREGDRVRRLYVVLDGAMTLARQGASGAELVLQRAEQGSLLAEASCFSKHYHCTASAIRPSRLVSVSREALLSGPGAAEFLTILAEDLSREVQHMRARCEMLALKTVSDRLDAWLSLHHGVLPAKGGWSSLATELAVTPEALYRALAAKRRPARSERAGSE